MAVDILHCEFIKAGIKAVRLGPGTDSKNDIKYDSRYKSFKEL